ncbi:MAG: hypothetical protein H6926_04920 [Chromatiales bacterium]|nr:hypothetical protein [Gammaproteobacteria bacterium]MCP5352512.1 hypothetical protein [Chromatiales bacterium]
MSFWDRLLGRDPGPDPVAQALDDLGAMIGNARSLLMERDMMIPRRYYYFLMFVYGAIDAYAEERRMNESQVLGVLLRYVRDVLKIEEGDIPTVLAHAQDYRGHEEGGRAFRIGGDAWRAWLKGDRTGIYRLRDDLAELGPPAEKF